MVFGAGVNLFYEGLGSTKFGPFGLEDKYVKAVSNQKVYSDDYFEIVNLSKRMTGTEDDLAEKLKILSSQPSAEPSPGCIGWKLIEAQ